jgi:hypothetical protein
MIKMLTWIIILIVFYDTYKSVEYYFNSILTHNKLISTLKHLNIGF